MPAKAIRCKSCGKERLLPGHVEATMKIYDVHLDAYFCDQACKDKYQNIERDKEGMWGS